MNQPASSPPPGGNLRCRVCRQVGGVEIEHATEDALTLHCRACGASWSFLAITGNEDEIPKH